MLSGKTSEVGAITVNLRTETARDLYARHGDKLRYVVVGACNTALHYVLFLVLLALVGDPLHSLAERPSELPAFIGSHYYLIVQWAAWVLIVPLAATNFKYFVFHSPGRLHRQILRAYLVYLPAQLISMGLLWLSVKVLGLPPALGQLITIVVATIIGYIGHRYFTFRVPVKVDASAKKVAGDSETIGDGSRPSDH
jgi:putative flippase GtrA